MSSIGQLFEPSDLDTSTIDDLFPIVIDGEEKEDDETEGFTKSLEKRDAPTNAQKAAARAAEMEQEEMMLDDDACRGAVELDDIPIVEEDYDNDEMGSAEESVRMS